MSRDKIWAGNLVKVVSVNVLRLQNYFVYLLGHGAGVWCARVKKKYIEHFWRRFIIIATIRSCRYS